MKSRSLSANKEKSLWLGGMETSIPRNSRNSKTVENVSHEQKKKQKKKQSLSHMEVEIIQSHNPKFTAKQLTTVAVSFPGSGSINSSSFSFVVSRAQAFLNTCLKKTRIKTPLIKAILITAMKSSWRCQRSWLRTDKHSGS